MKPLTDLIKEHGNEIKQRLYLGCVHWENLVSRLEVKERSTSGVLNDEQALDFPGRMWIRHIRSRRDWRNLRTS